MIDFNIVINIISNNIPDKKPSNAPVYDQKNDPIKQNMIGYPMITEIVIIAFFFMIFYLMIRVLYFRQRYNNIFE